MQAQAENLRAKHKHADRKRNGRNWNDQPYHGGGADTNEQPTRRVARLHDQGVRQGQRLCAHVRCGSKAEMLITSR